MKRILIAVDGSAAADEAAEVGLELADEQGAQVTFVHVTPTVELAMGSYLAPAVPVEAEHLPTAAEDGVLQRAAALAAERAIPATIAERYGSAAEQIAAVADELDADIVVVGSRGLGAIGRVVLGSTSREVLRRTTRPVLVVRAERVAAAV
jgi:nucleotide-binding universal stress UspA family protein